MRHHFRAIRLIAYAFILAGCSAQNNGERGYQAAFEDACVQALSERLKSPSSLNVVEIVNASEKLAYNESDLDALLLEAKQLDEVDEAALSDIEKAQHRLDRTKLALKISGVRGAISGQATPTIFRAIIKYDADNSFGASLRDQALCEFQSTHGEFSDLNWDDVEINGQTNYEREMEDINAFINSR